MSRQLYAARLAEDQRGARVAGIAAGGPFPDIANTIMQAVVADAIRVTAHRRGQPGAAAIAGIRARAGPLIAPGVAPLGLTIRIPAGGLFPLSLERQAHQA